MRVIELPGEPAWRLEHVLLDLNGTLTAGGALLVGVAGRLARLAPDLRLHLATADTYGTAAALGGQLGLAVAVVHEGTEKAALVQALGADATVAIGNGRNDEAMLRAARLGIAVVGPEGAATAAMLAADLVCHSVTDALDLLLDQRRLIAGLRR